VVKNRGGTRGKRGPLYVEGRPHIGRDNPKTKRGGKRERSEEATSQRNAKSGEEKLSSTGKRDRNIDGGPKKGTEKKGLSNNHQRMGGALKKKLRTRPTKKIPARALLKRMGKVLQKKERGD